MMGMVLYGLVAVALAAAAGLALISFNHTSQQTTVAQENNARMEVAVTALRANLRAALSTGTLYAPMDDVAVSATHKYTQLPSWLGVVDGAPWGQPYLYCPVAPQNASLGGAATTTSTVTEPNGATYTLTVTNSAATSVTGGKAYVVSGTTTDSLGAAIPNGQGYVGFLISSLGLGQIMPNCSDITIVNGVPKVTSGSVRGVTGGLPFTQRVIASANHAVIYVAATTLNQKNRGDGTGVDINNPTTLDNAIGIWKSMQPRVTEIVLTGGAALSIAQTLQVTDTISGVAMVGDAAAPALIFTTNDGSSLNFTAAQITNTPVSFYNIAVNFATIFPTTSISLKAQAPITFVNSTVSGARANMAIVIQGKAIFQNTILKNLHIKGYGADISNWGDNFSCAATPVKMTEVSYEVYDSTLSFASPDCAQDFIITNSVDSYKAIFASNSRTFIGKGSQVSITTNHNIEFAGGEVDIGEQRGSGTGSGGTYINSSTVGHPSANGSLYVNLTKQDMSPQSWSGYNGQPNSGDYPAGGAALVATPGTNVNVMGSFTAEGSIGAVIALDHAKLLFSGGNVQSVSKSPNIDIIYGGFGVSVLGTGQAGGPGDKTIKNCLNTKGELIAAPVAPAWFHVSATLTPGAGNTALLTSGGYPTPTPAYLWQFWGSPSAANPGAGNGEAFVNSKLTSSTTPDANNVDLYCSK